MIDHDIELVDDSGGFAFDRSARRFDLDGRLHVVDCRISAARVNEYLGSELEGAGVTGLDVNRLYRMYRDRAALKAAVPTFENLPLMITHVSVTAAEPQKLLTVGTVSNVRYSHPHLVADLAIWDAEAIRLIESGQQKEISCGYRYCADMTPGKVDGDAFDGRFVDIVGNHVALVTTGRVGPDVAVNDAAPGVPMHLAFKNWDRYGRLC